MMTLISLAIVVAFVTSWAGTLALFEVEIWWELATLITIMLLGHWLEMRSIAQARGALVALAELLPDTAERVAADGSTETVPSPRSGSTTSFSSVPARASQPTGSWPTARPTLTSRWSPESHGRYRKGWATGYNLVAIPVAGGVLVPWGFDLPMAVGAIAMSASMIIVAANAQLLRRLRLRSDGRHP